MLSNDSTRFRTACIFTTLTLRENTCPIASGDYSTPVSQRMKRFNERMRHEYGGGKTDIWQMNKQFVMETWWWPLTIQGFGGWKLTMGDKDAGSRYF